LLLLLLLALLLLPPRQPLGLLLDARHWRRSAHRLSHHLSHLLTHLSGLGLLPHQPLPPLPFAPLPIPTALLLPPPRGAPLGHVDLGRPDNGDGEGGVGWASRGGSGPLFMMEDMLRKKGGNEGTHKRVWEWTFTFNVFACRMQLRLYPYMYQ